MEIHKIDPSDPTTIVSTTTLAAGYGDAIDIEWEGGGIWFTTAGSRYLKRMGPGSTAVDSYDMGPVMAEADGPEGIAFNGTNLFICGPRLPGFIKQHRLANIADWVPVFSITNPYGLAWDGSNIRVVSGESIYRYDIWGNELDSFTPPGGTPRAVDFKADYDWSKIYTFGAYLK